MKTKIALYTASAFALAAVFSAEATARTIACECFGEQCGVDKGRESVKFSYDPHNPSSYDAAELQAMREVDANALEAANSAQAKVACEEPCVRDTVVEHGPPFAGSLSGSGEGEARSRWKVEYDCYKLNPPPEPIDEAPEHPWDEPQPEHHSGGGFSFGVGVGVGGEGGEDHEHHENQPQTQPHD